MAASAGRRGATNARSLWDATPKSSIKSMAVIQRHGARSPVYNCMLGSPMEDVARERDFWGSYAAFNFGLVPFERMCHIPFVLHVFCF